ncbi:oxidoreductase [Erwinia sp. OLTSP20]|uniref:SDR family oxidoreductase n=1 Tax=unclassified Erwinia TaxID=2622719 RepID=UPI000C18BBEA|nr:MULTISPECIES: SDR family oxidoreductase [unclassified Erwinia]PIJ50670.1 oxidoreductase [Erwinia sp. OAMSP11]PIJ72713.1 oxidoreductase [Erwinia sp. OLSSP12]PIJ83266.1 oxidoreductase [Erwinia sp. OLCASP19]PIJ85294.1 oxidoreductase [Erwinia sp. OLMTSP26]PIJ87297.1 oxidoreductase [Erwinia sp. OLMDSP33]
MQKAVVITGCSSGIGLTAANDLLQRGYRVLATCRKTEDVERMNQLGFTGIQLDLNDEQSVEQAARQILAACDNRLYALFNNGGYGLYGPLQSVTRRQLEQQFATNLFGTHQLTRCLLPAMLAHGEGRIISTSSVMGLISTAGRGAYAASKYALEAWNDALRHELHGSGIRVSLIEPGPIDTRFSDNVNQTQRDKPVQNPGIAARFTLPATAILPALRHALESHHPRLRYPVTLVSWGITFLLRLLPATIMDMILRVK